MADGPGGHPGGQGLGLGRTGGQRGVLATVHSQVSTVLSNPRAAEWAGKSDTWDLVASVGVPPGVVKCAAGDCTSAALGLDGGCPVG